MREMQVSTLQSRHNRLVITHSGLVASGSPYTVSVSTDTEFATMTLNHLHPRVCIDLQSRECQKLHWKLAHKAVCSGNAAVIQNIGESPEEKARAKEIRLWMNAWTPVISYCLPLALDLANHDFGRHDTHAYVPSTMGSKSAFPDSIPTRSLLMFLEHTGLNGVHQSYRVGEFHTA